MSYIKVNIREELSNNGKTSKTKIARMESDLPSIATNEIPIILRALSLSNDNDQFGFPYTFPLTFKSIRNE